MRAISDPKPIASASQGQTPHARKSAPPLILIIHQRWGLGPRGPGLWVEGQPPRSLAFRPKLGDAPAAREFCSLTLVKLRPVHFTDCGASRRVRTRKAPNAHERRCSSARKQSSGFQSTTIPRSGSRQTIGYHRRESVSQSVRLFRAKQDPCGCLSRHSASIARTLG